MATERTSNVLSVVALVAGLVISLGLAFTAFAVSLCALWGEQCTDAEEQQISLLMLAAVGVFLLVPVAVAWVRRQARWLLAPLIEAALVVTVVLAAGAF